MKYIFGFVGMFIGQFVGRLVADHWLIGWTLGVILAVIGYQIPSFIRYTRSTPKQLLAFHGPDAPISRSTSSGELRTFLGQLREGGLLLDFHPHNDFATVDKVQWDNLDEPERLTLVQVLMQTLAVYGASPREIRFLDRNGVVLAKYSIADRIARPLEIGR